MAKAQHTKVSENSQGAVNTAESAHHSMRGAHQLSLGLGHTHISEGKVDGKIQWLVTPSWSLNYDYWISDKWAIGLQNDFIIESFIVENEDKELVERENPFIMVPVGLFKPGKHWSFIGGLGVEFAKTENLFLTRLGVEYGWHLPKDWELGVALVWDNRWQYYNAWAISITVGKIWPKKSH